LGIDQGTHGPHVLRKIVHAGAQNTSFASGSENLQVLAGLKIPEKQVERLTKSIGQERLEQRESQVQAFLELPLMERVAAPAHAPNLAVVSMDGGRIQILDRQAPAAEPSDPGACQRSTPASPPEPPEDEDEDEEGEADQDQHCHGHWREDKIGLLMTMTSEESSEDPCPQIPQTLVNPLKIPKLAREIKRGIPAGEDGVAESVEDDPASPWEECAEYTPPKVRLKSMVGTRARAKRFGAILAAAAFARGFFGASRKAFVADGAETNWTTHRHWFSDFVPILDFIHALSYVFPAAMANRSFSQGWEVYQRWITLVWKGRVAEVIAELEQRQKELGLPEAGDSETSPRQVVADALRYLKNNQDRMKYDEYRRLGLPIVSSHVESTVKQFNRRVKGTEKFWSEPGAEALLQLRADYLSETEPMDKYWQERETRATGRRVYRRSG
jgi:hypothetical protein